MKRATRAVALAALSSLILGGLACMDIGDPIGSGPATVSLVTPNTTDRAILVAITGPGIEEIKPASSGYTVHWKLVSDHEARVVIFGSLWDGPMFTMTVPDRQDLAGYSGTVLQVSDNYNDLRGSTEEYEVTIAASDAN